MQCARRSNRLCLLAVGVVAPSCAFLAPSSGLPVSKHENALRSGRAENRLPILAVAGPRILARGSDDSIRPGEPYRFESRAVDPDGDEIQYDCTYDRVGLSPHDPRALPAPRDCRALPSLQPFGKAMLTLGADFDDGTLSWRPLSHQSGTYRFTITARDASDSVSRSFYVTVLEAPEAENPIARFDAAFATASNGGIPALVPATTANGTRESWPSLDGSFEALLETFTTPQPWSGVGSFADPYHLRFNGRDDSLTVPNAFGRESRVRLSAWLAPRDVSSAGATLFSTSGFRVEQAADGSGKLELRPEADEHDLTPPSGCRSPNAWSNDTWGDLSVIVGPTGGSLFWNAQSLCSYIHPTSPGSDLTVGSRGDGSKAWAGALAELRLFGEVNGSPGGVSEIARETLRRTRALRVIPAGEVVEEKLSFHLDAANARERSGAFPAGCSSESESWLDLGNFFLSGTLLNFANCTETGWQGSGRDTDPHRLVFDGTDDEAQVGYLTGREEFTLTGWVQWAGGGSAPQSLVFIGRDERDDSADVGLVVSPSVHGKLRLGITTSGMAGESFVEADRPLPPNEWTHLAITGSGNHFRIYLNAREVASGASKAATVKDISDWDSTTYIALAPNPAYRRFRGAVAELQGYGRALEPGEILQNCTATQGRYFATPPCLP